MPLTEKGADILAAMKKQYGEKKGEEVFYASRNAGTISGVDSTEHAADSLQAAAPVSLNATIDTMSEQLNSIGQTAKAIVERFAPRGDASPEMQAFKERQAARFGELAKLEAEAKALDDKVRQAKKAKKGDRYIGDAISRAEQAARRAIGTVGLAINDLKNGNAYRFEEKRSEARRAISEAASAVAGIA